MGFAVFGVWGFWFLGLLGSWGFGDWGFFLWDLEFFYGTCSILMGLGIFLWFGNWRVWVFGICGFWRSLGFGIFWGLGIHGCFVIWEVLGVFFNSWCRGFLADKYGFCDFGVWGFCRLGFSGIWAFLGFGYF